MTSKNAQLACVHVGFGSDFELMNVEALGRETLCLGHRAPAIFSDYAKRNQIKLYCRSQEVQDKLFFCS